MLSSSSAKDHSIVLSPNVSGRQKEDRFCTEIPVLALYSSILIAYGDSIYRFLNNIFYAHDQTDRQTYKMTSIKRLEFMSC